MVSKRHCGSRCYVVKFGGLVAGSIYGSNDHGKRLHGIKCRGSGFGSSPTAGDHFEFRQRDAVCGRDRYPNGTFRVLVFVEQWSNDAIN